MRVARMDKDFGKTIEAIEDVGVIKKLKDFKRYGESYGDCLYVDSVIYVVGTKLDELFDRMLREGFLDLRNYESFELGF